jgi:hypothetical protein
VLAAGCSGGSQDTGATPTTGAAGSTEAAAIDVPTGPRELVDATASLGIDTALTGIRGHAVASADVNGDGWADLFVGTFADRPVESYQERGADGPAPDRLLLGSSTGFEVDPDFEGRLGRTAGAAFADLDGDGDPELIVSRNVRSDSDRSAAPSEIYRNEEGTLVPAAVLDETRGGRAIGIVDFDLDGNDDIVLVEDRWSSEQGTGVFRNEGDLQFREVTAEVGFPSGVFGLGIGVGDLNGDDIDDLVVGGSNTLFLGDGAGFAEGTASPLPWELHGDEDDPAHVALTDADGDGRLDILIGQHFNSTLDTGIAEPVRLFLNTTADGDDQPSFDDATLTSGMPELDTKSPQILLVDVDGDRDDDLVTTASYATDDGLRPFVAYSGGAGRQLQFEAASKEATGPHYWIDAVTLDANGDGIDDLFFVEWEPALSSSLFLNLPISDG